MPNVIKILEPIVVKFAIVNEYFCCTNISVGGPHRHMNESCVTQLIVILFIK